MRTVVVGGGALGSILAGHLARAGQPVTLVARGSRADTIEKHGLTISGLSNFSTAVPVVRSAREVEAADLVVLATTTYDTRAALDGLRLPPSAMVMSVQNGVQKNDDLAGLFGPGSVIGAAALISGEMQGDTTAFTVRGSLPLGKLHGRPSARADEVAKLLTHVGIPSQQVSNIQSVEWSKYAIFSALMAPAVLTRLPTWRFTSDPSTAGIVTRIVREIGALAKASGVELNDDGFVPAAEMCRERLEDAIAVVLRLAETLAKSAPGHRVSALQDLERGRQLEVEETLGYASRRAGQLGVEIPTIDTCYRLARILGQPT